MRKRRSLSTKIGAFAWHMIIDGVARLYPRSVLLTAAEQEEANHGGTVPSAV